MNEHGTTERERDEDPASGYLAVLREETMQEAWGDRSPEDRRRIVVAAIIFGEEFDKRLAEDKPGPDPRETQRLLMNVINAAIDEFSRRESLDRETAASFLSEVETRDLILEFDEVLEARETNPEKSLDALLKDAIDSRRRKARWADHWTSG